MSIGKKKGAAKIKADKPEIGSRASLLQEEQSWRIDPVVLREFGIPAEEASKIRGRKDLIRIIASKMVQVHEEVVDEVVLSNVELMIETDPQIREFIDRCFKYN